MTPTYLHRKKWPSGEWDKEPDTLLWVHKGLKCAIFRNSFGGLCGYVGVESDHPYWKTDYPSLKGIEIHGGLTFSGWIDEEKDLFYLGFDCCHSGDVTPYDMLVEDPSLIDNHRTYKNLEYVKKEVEGLAEALALLAPPKGTSSNKTTLYN